MKCSEKDWIDRMHVGEQLQVEVYAHGAWWKDGNGTTGQVPASEVRKGPLAMVELASVMEDEDGQ